MPIPTAPVTFETRQDMLRALPFSGHVAELGVYCGDFSSDLLELCPGITELDLVDAWSMFARHIPCGDQDGNNMQLCVADELEAHVTASRSPARNDDEPLPAAFSGRMPEGQAANLGRLLFTEYLLPFELLSVLLLVANLVAYYAMKERASSLPRPVPPPVIRMRLPASTSSRKGCWLRGVMAWASFWGSRNQLWLRR